MRRIIEQLFEAVESNVGCAVFAGVFAGHDGCLHCSAHSVDRANVRMLRKAGRIPLAPDPPTNGLPDLAHGLLVAEQRGRCGAFLTAKADQNMNQPTSAPGPEPRLVLAGIPSNTLASSPMTASP